MPQNDEQATTSEVDESLNETDAHSSDNEATRKQP